MEDKVNKQIDKDEVAKAQKLRTDELVLGVRLNDAQEARREAEGFLSEKIRAGETTGNLALDLALSKYCSNDPGKVTGYQKIIDLLKGQSGQLILTRHVTTEDTTPEIKYMSGGFNHIASPMRSYVTTHYHRVGILDGDSPIPKESKGTLWTSHDIFLPTTRYASFSCSDAAFGVYEPKFDLSENSGLEVLLEEGGIPESLHPFAPWGDTETSNENICCVMVGNDQVEAWLKEQGGDELHNQVLEMLNVLVLTAQE